MSDLAVGVSTGCFLNQHLRVSREDIRNSGFGRLEICSWPAHLDYHDRVHVQKAAARMDELGLETYSFHAPFSERIDITSPDAGVRGPCSKELYKRPRPRPS